jgi:hypothetical protein
MTTDFCGGHAIPLSRWSRTLPELGLPEPVALVEVSGKRGASVGLSAKVKVLKRHNANKTSVIRFFMWMLVYRSQK